MVDHDYGPFWLRCCGQRMLYEPGDNGDQSVGLQATSGGWWCEKCDRTVSHDLADDAPEPASASEVARLRAIVDRLPKTADGVPIVSGMEVFRSSSGTKEWAITDLRSHRGDHLDIWDAYYSTSEAASAALTPPEVT